MNTRLLRMLNERVSLEIEETNGTAQYDVYNRTKKFRFLRKPTYSNWELVISTSNIKKANLTKHNLWMLLIRDLGYRPWAIERRKKRFKK